MKHLAPTIHQISLCVMGITWISSGRDGWLNRN